MKPTMQTNTHHTKNQRPDVLLVVDIHSFPDIIQAESEVRRRKLLDGPSRSTFEGLCNKTDILILSYEV